MKKSGSINFAVSAFLVTICGSNSVMAADMEQKEKPWSASLAGSWIETPVDSDSADHSRILGATASFSYALNSVENNFFKAPSVTVSVGVSDQVDVEDNNSDLGNTTILFQGFKCQLNDVFSLSQALQVTLPTNEDDRRFMDFQGAFSYIGSISSQADASEAGLSYGLTYSLQKYFYEFDTNRGGRYNQDYATLVGLKLAYTTQIADAYASVGSASERYTDGSLSDAAYNSRAGIAFKVLNPIVIGMEWSQSDRLFDYGGTSSNFSIDYAYKTRISTSVSYSF